MIGLDTNILVRYFTQDNEVQAQIVENIIENYGNSPNSLFINNIVMCELVLVLEKGYKYSKEQVALVINQMLSTEEFAFEKQELLWLALNEYVQNKSDYSDTLIGLINKSSDCLKTITFDEDAAKGSNFKLAEI
ncbi:MAG: PIN domain-containing protein [Alphaproteobacteria bacterium]|nr:PIN domain-containing protein [Alphaproteobacteria bacterium]